MENIIPAKKHAKLSASGSAMWMNCPGSIQAQEGLPNTSSPFAEEGTLAHELADMCLKAQVDAEFYIGEIVNAESNGKEISVVVDREMANFIQEYLDYVRSFETENSQLFTEEKVSFSHIVDNGFGTIDSAIFDYDIKVLHIFDLKYGRGIEVSAIDNTQGLLYAAGIKNELGWIGIEKIVIHIVQPRKYNTSSFEVSIEELIKFEEFAKQKALETAKINAKRVAGEKQCEFCLARFTCKERDMHFSRIIINDFKDLTEDDMDNISNERIKTILDNKNFVIKFLKDIETNAFERLSKGEAIPGYKLVQGISNRKWLPEAENVLIEKLGEKAYSKELINITAAEKLLNKKEVNELTYKPESAIKLVKESDKKEPIKSVIDYFDNLNDNKDEKEL